MKSKKIRFYGSHVSLAWREDIPSLLSFSFCSLVTVNASALVSHVSVVQLYTYGSIRIPLHVRRPFIFFRHTYRQGCEVTGVVILLMSHHWAGLPSWDSGSRAADVRISTESPRLAKWSELLKPHACFTCFGLILPYGEWSPAVIKLFLRDSLLLI